MVRPTYLLFLFLFTLFLHSLGNASLPLIDRDEPRFAEASREMKQSGDFIIPRVNGDFRFDKPPLIYWCQVAAFNVLGDNDFAARLPSVLFAALTTMVTALWGSRIFSPKVGLCAGLIFATCLQVFIHSRAAVADMPMIFFFVAASWSDWERQRRNTLWLWWTFYLSLGLGFLSKGPISLLPMIFSPLQALITHKPFRLNLLSSLGGLGVVLLVVGSWGIPALITTHGEFFQIGIGKHVVGRSFAAMDHHGGSGWLGYILFLPFYFVTLFFSFFPWCIFIPKTFVRLRSRIDRDELYLLITIVAIFAVFTLVQTKLPHYTLPCFPMLAILMARGIAADPRFKVVLVASTLVFLAIALLGFRAIEPFFLSKTIALQALPQISPETRTASLNYNECSIWYFRSKTHSFHVRLDPIGLARFMNEPGPAICVANKESLTKATINPGWHSFTTSGYNFTRWKLQPTTLLGWHFFLPLPQQLELVTLIKQ